MDNPGILDIRHPWSWLPLLLLAVALLLVFGLDLNRSLFHAINPVSHATGTALWQWLTTFGDSLVVFSLALLLVGRRPDWLWALMLGAVTGAVAVHGLKEWSDAYGVYRPANYFGADEMVIIGETLKRVSFPSGHTAAAFTLTALVCLQGGVATRWKWAAVLAAVLVAISRIAVGAHWPLDVLGGALVAWLSMLAALRLAPQIGWGEGLGAQRLFALLLVIAALQLLFAHDSGYPAARWLEMAIAAGCLLAALPQLRQLFARSTGEERAEQALADPEPIEPRSFVGLLVRLVVTVAIFALIFRSVDFEGVSQSLRGMVPRLLLLGLVFQLLSTLLAAYRWHRVMRPLGFGGDFNFYLRSYFKGSFFNQGLPTSIGGDAVRVLDVSRLGHRKREAFYGVAVDRILGLAGLLLLNLIANAINPGLLPEGIFWLINGIAAAGLLGVVALYLFHYLRWPLAWKPTRLFHHISRHMAGALHSPREALIQTGLSLAVHLLSMMAIFLIGRAVMVEYDLLTFLIVVPPVILFTLVPISLAGWGVREGAMIGLFTLIGAEQAAVLSMSILYGIVLIVSSLPGFLVYFGGRQRL